MRARKIKARSGFVISPRPSHISAVFKRSLGDVLKRGPTVLMLDYFWMQCNYFAESYGTNWLTTKLDKGFVEGGLEVMLLPVDKAGEVRRMYEAAITERLAISTPRLATRKAALFFSSSSSPFSRSLFRASLRARRRRRRRSPPFFPTAKKKRARAQALERRRARASTRPPPPSGLEAVELELICIADACTHHPLVAATLAADSVRCAGIDSRLYVLDTLASWVSFFFTATVTGRACV